MVLGVGGCMVLVGWLVDDPDGESSNKPGGDVRFLYGIDLAPGAEEVVVMQAVAAHPGDYAGEIEFCIGDTVHCLSQVVRTSVVTPDGDRGVGVPAESPARIPAELSADRPGSGAGDAP